MRLEGRRRRWPWLLLLLLLATQAAAELAAALRQRGSLHGLHRLHHLLLRVVECLLLLLLPLLPSVLLLLPLLPSVLLLLLLAAPAPAAPTSAPPSAPSAATGELPPAAPAPLLRQAIWLLLALGFELAPVLRLLQAGRGDTETRVDSHRRTSGGQGRPGPSTASSTGVGLSEWRQQRPKRVQLAWRSRLRLLTFSRSKQC